MRNSGTIPGGARTRRGRAAADNQRCLQLLLAPIDDDGRDMEHEERFTLPVPCPARHGELGKSCPVVAVQPLSRTQYTRGNALS
jgi:hypothetical protein